MKSYQEHVRLMVSMWATTSDQQTTQMTELAEEKLINQKRVVVSIRQRADSEFDEVVGSVKTKTFIVKSEDSKNIQELVYKNVELGVVLHVDKHQGYDIFHAHYDMKRVNRSKEHKSTDGACNNQSESYNVRFRRMEYRQCP